MDQIPILENKLNALKALAGCKNNPSYFEYASYNFTMVIQIIMVIIVIKYIFDSQKNQQQCYLKPIVLYEQRQQYINNDYVMIPNWSSHY